MPNTTERAHDGAVGQIVHSRISSTFRLGDSAYMLVEEHSAAALAPPNQFSGAIGVGRCELNGKTYVVLRLDPTMETAKKLAEIMTGRELEIATLVALGWPNKQIADHLHISEWTVSAHLRRVFAKLGVHSRAAMVYQCTVLIGVRHNGKPYTLSN